MCAHVPLRWEATPARPRHRHGSRISESACSWALVLVKYLKRPGSKIPEKSCTSCPNGVELPQCVAVIREGEGSGYGFAVVAAAVSRPLSWVVVACCVAAAVTVRSKVRIRSVAPP